MHTWKKHPYMFLFCILLIGFCIRIYHVDTNPAGFFADEASIGYNAYLLGTKGTDEHGAKFPIFFQSFGDYRPPIPFYAAIPFVALFGLTEFAVRFASVVIGTATIALLFYTVLAMHEGSQPHSTEILRALIAAGLLAIAPWHIHFSRFGTENIYLPFMVLVATLAFLKCEKDSRWILVAYGTSALIGYTYLAGVVIGPLFTLCMTILFGKTLFPRIQWTILAILLYSICMLPTINAIATNKLTTRWNNVGIKNMDMQKSINLFTFQYLEHFSLDFLFHKGDVSYPGHFIRRFGIRDMGQLYWIDLPFLIRGMALLIYASWKNKGAAVATVLLFLYPVGGSITNADGGGPLAFRSVLGSVALIIPIAYGMTWAYQWVRQKSVKRIIMTALIIGYACSVGRYLYLYHTHYPRYSQDFFGWQYGPRNIMKRFLQQTGNYNGYIVVGSFNSPEIFIQFYDPTNKCNNRCKTHSDLKPVNWNTHQLFAIGANIFEKNKPPVPHTIRETINYPNGTTAFYIVSTP